MVSSSCRFLPQRCGSLVGLIALTLGLTLGSARQAQALTIVLDFVTAPTTDIFGITTSSANYSPFGFIGLSTVQIQQSVLFAITQDYLGYPTVGQDPLSPLPNGKQLNIDFLMSTGLGAPTNGDLEYYFMAVGDDTGSHPGLLGQACLSCIRNAVGVGPNGAANHAIVGSILVDNIDDLAPLASTNVQRTNLLAGTTSHEAGHSLSLDHAPSTLPNPGESAYSLMATGGSPTNMPNSQRILDRDFAYSEFAQLIAAVGLRDAPASVSVPEPEMLWLVSLSLLLLAASVRTQRSVSQTPRLKPA